MNELPGQKEIISQQKVWLRKLQNASPRELNGTLKPLLCSYSPMFKYRDGIERRGIAYGRTILRNEIVFDFDTTDWSAVKSEGDKLLSCLNYNGIPYLLAWSGGKGIHVHIFFKTPDIEITKGLRGVSEEEQTAALKSLDLPQLVRSRLFRCLVDEAKITMNAKLDFTRVDWSSSGQGMLIREFGAIRDSGSVKTLINDIPSSRPTPGELPLVFPNSIVEWAPSMFNEEVAKAIGYALLLRLEKRERPMVNHDGQLNKIPCYNHFMNGMKEGSRRDGAFWVSRFNWITDHEKEDATEEILRYCANCIPTDARLEAQCLSTLDSVYRSGQRVKENPGCNKIRHRFGPEICKREGCAFGSG